MCTLSGVRNLDINFVISRVKRVLKNILIIRPAWSQSFKCSMTKKKNNKSNELSKKKNWKWNAKRYMAGKCRLAMISIQIFASIERARELERTKWLKNANGMVVFIEWHSKQVLKTNFVLCTTKQWKMAWAGYGSANHISMCVYFDIAFGCVSFAISTGYSSADFSISIAL